MLTFNFLFQKRITFAAISVVFHFQFWIQKIHYIQTTQDTKLLILTRSQWHPLHDMPVMCLLLQLCMVWAHPSSATSPCTLIWLNITDLADRPHTRLR